MHILDKFLHLVYNEYRHIIYNRLTDEMSRSLYVLKDKVNNLMNIIDDDDEDDEELLEELQGTKKKFFGLFG